MKLNPKYIQLTGDGAIPILGFFFWNWNLYFILLFYFLDMFTKEIILHAKSKKITNYKAENQLENLINEKKSWMKFGFLSILILSFSILISQIIMPFVQPNFNASKQVVAFLTYKEMGIEQGFVLIPLIAFMGFFQYKMEFIQPAVFAKINVSQLWQPHISSMIVLLAFSALSLGIVQFVQLPEWFFVIGIVVISSFYQIITLKKSM